MSRKKKVGYRAALVVALLLILSLYPSQAFSQASFDINVSAEVTSVIELTTIQSIRITRDDIVNNVATVDPLTSGNTGKMIATGAPNSEITISFQRSHELVHLEGAASLIFNYTVAGNDVNDQSSAELLELQSRGLRFNNDGEFYIWIGGNVDISAAEPGGYQGEFTLEIEYI